MITKLTTTLGEFLAIKIVHANATWFEIRKGQGIAPPVLLYNYGPLRFEREYIQLPPGDWTPLDFGSKLTEEQWRGIVEKMPWGEDNYKNYLHQSPRSVQLVGKTATESGHSLLKSHGIYLVNPLGDEPKDVSDLGAFTVMMREKWRQWQSAQEKVYDPLILRRVR